MNLKHITINNCARLNNTTGIFPNLEDIILAETNILNDSLPLCPGLKGFSIRGGTIESEYLNAYLEDKRNLEYLELVEINLPDNFLQRLGQPIKFPNIEEVILKNIRGLTLDAAIDLRPGGKLAGVFPPGLKKITLIGFDLEIGKEANIQAIKQLYPRAKVIVDELDSVA